MNCYNGCTREEGRRSLQKRSFHRIEAIHPILYYSNVYPRPKVASTLDLSLGGAKIETRYTLAKNQGLEISIGIHPNVIKCQGTVIYVLQLEDGKLWAGIRFDQLTKQDRLLLGQYISYFTEEKAQRPESDD